VKRTRLVAASAGTVLALVTALLYGLPAIGQPVPDADYARGYAYGASALGGEEPQLDPLPERESVAPPPQPQEQVKRVSKQDIAVETSVADFLRIESDACLDTGASARLQFQINRARILARGQTLSPGETSENEGPNDPDPERELVRYPVGFPTTARCVAPANSDTPIQGPTPTGSPSPTPTSSPTASPTSSPTATPTGTPTPGATPTPTGTPARPPNCEVVVTNPNAANFSPVCRATSPLWHARGWARAVNVAGLVEEIRAEAVARCTEDGRLRVATGAAFGPTSSFNSNAQRPNQRLQVSSVGIAAVTFWETNWDPISNTTTDGSDTVWVNGLHIITSTGRDLIFSHAEATADCPAEPETPTPTDSTPTIEPPAACTPTPGREPSGLIIIGTQGPDAVAGTERDDIICTLGGDDLVDGLGGADLIILGSGNDEAEGGGGKDTIHGEEGNDSMSGGLFHDLLIGGEGNDQMKGTRGIDTLRGNQGADTLQGGDGDDVLRGGKGNDSLRGYNGDDLLNGDAGFDQCVAGRGRDRVKNCEGRGR